MGAEERRLSIVSVRVLKKNNFCLNLRLFWGTAIKVLLFKKGAQMDQEESSVELRSDKSKLAKLVPAAKKYSELQRLGA